MTGSHYLPLVIISAIVAMIASYAALDLSSRVSEATGVSRRFWLMGGSVAMGVGIWSMHFIGMLAFHLPVAIRYNIPLWLASVAIAIGASTLALNAVSRSDANNRSLLTAALLMGLAIAGMHYTGMAAIRVHAEMRYDLGLVAVSIVIAVVASYVALFLALHFRDDGVRYAAMGKALSAMVMGLAITGMHYTGMAGATFHPIVSPQGTAGPEFIATRGLAVAVTITSLFVLGLSLVSARIDRRIKSVFVSWAKEADAQLLAVVDERLEVQEKLRESHESYRSLFDSLNELVFVTSLEGRFLDANEAARRIYGYGDELIGMSPEMLIDTRKVKTQESRRRIEEAAAGRPQQFESWARTRDGRSFPVEVVLTVGEYFGERVLIAAARDITDRKRAEIELASAEAHYRSLVESSPFGIISCDLRGSIMKLNAAAERMLGTEPAGGTSLADLAEPDDRKALANALVQMSGGAVRTRDIELRVRAANGEVRLLALTLSLVDGPAVTPSIHGIARDITSEKQQEQQLRRADRLAGVGTLIGGVAHELNNPLTTIQSFAELLLMENRSDEDREALDTMKREAARAARIVSDLRLIARGTQEDPSTGSQGPVDVNEVVRQVVKLRAYALAMENIEIREELDRELPPVNGDRAQLEQAILNLVMNATQAMESSPDRRLLVKTRREGTRVAIEITDTGVGIPSADLEKIFDPFWTTKAPGVGTGLGLSLVHSIVSDHSGMIRVHSQQGEGSTFVISLPAAVNERSIGQNRPLPVMADNPLRLLLVEDEPGIRRVLQHYLQRRGHQVDVAREGGEALTLIAQTAASNPYDVIISDIRMPGIGGDRLLEELQARGDGFDRRIIFISGDAASTQTKRLMDDARVPMLYKPFALEDLSSMVERFAEEIPGIGTRNDVGGTITRQAV